MLSLAESHVIINILISLYPYLVTMIILVTMLILICPYKGPLVDVIACVRPYRTLGFQRSYTVDMHHSN